MAVAEASLPSLAVGIVTDLISSLVMYKLELTLVVDPVRMERIKFPSVKTHLVLSVKWR